MDLRLGEKTDVANLLLPRLMGAPQFGENGGVLSRIDEVVHLVTVALQIVELLGRLFLPEVRLRLVQLAFIEQAPPNPRRRGLEHVVDVLTVDPVRQVLPQVDMTTVRDRSHEIDALIHATAEAKIVFASRLLEGTGKSDPLHPLLRFDPGEAQHRRREVNKGDETVACATNGVFVRSERLPFFGHVDEERHMETRMIGPSLVPRHSRTVIAPVENDRVIGEPRFLDLAEPLAELLVHHREPVIILRPILPHRGRVGMIGRHTDLRRIMETVFLRDRIPDLRFVGNRGIENGEKGLSLGAIFPVGLAAALVPNIVAFHEIVILLRGIRAVVARLAEIGGKELHPFGQGRLRAHRLGSRRRRIDPRDHRRSCRSADRSVRPRAGVA